MWPVRGKTVSMLLIAVLLCALFTSSALSEPDGYPAIKIDPKTGNAYDLGGKTVYFYDYRATTDWHSQNPSNEGEQATYNYRNWIEETYNCNVVVTQKGDWGTCAEEFIKFAQNPDGRLCIFTVEPGKIGRIMLSTGLVASWDTSSSINLNESKWNRGTMELTTRKGSVYGVSTGDSKPTICLYFNKRILEEAGLDWNSIYNMQKDGTWTWSQFVELLKIVNGDHDKDGISDIYGLTGSFDDLARGAVFSNEGSFFDYDNDGDLSITSGSDNTKMALNWAKTIWNTYARKQRNSENWDYYKEVWKEGHVAFYIYEAYGGFSSNSEMSDMQDPWGCVAFPKGPCGKKYITVISNDAAMIPNVYSDDELSKITLIYDLWNSPTPNIQESELTQFDGLTDERSIYETYAMLSEEDAAVADKTNLLGTVNDILGNSLLWRLQDEEVGALLDAAKGAWSSYVYIFNNTETKGDNPAIHINAKKLIIPSNVTVIGESAFEKVGAEIIVIPSGCTSIGSHAFADNPQLLKVYIPFSVVYIANDAFEGSNPEIVWQQ